MVSGAVEEFLNRSDNLWDFDLIHALHVIIATMSVPARRAVRRVNNVFVAAVAALPRGFPPAVNNSRWTFDGPCQMHEKAD
jgi:hypothetical protein